MAAVLLQVIPRFIQLYQKTVFLFLQTHEKYIVVKKYFIARHDDKMCFLPNCRSPEILIGDIKRVPTKSLCFLFQLPTRGLSSYTFQVPIHWQTVKSG